MLKKNFLVTLWNSPRAGATRCTFPLGLTGRPHCRIKPVLVTATTLRFTGLDGTEAKKKIIRNHFIQSVKIKRILIIDEYSVNWPSDQKYVLIEIFRGKNQKGMHLKNIFRYNTYNELSGMMFSHTIYKRLILNTF